MIDASFDRPEASESAGVTEATEALTSTRVVLVDGFNVLHTVLLKREREAGWWRRTVRERLLRRVQAWPDAQDQIWVAFDGAEPAWSVWAEPVARPRLGGVAGASSLLSGRPGRPERPGPIVHSVYVESADDWIVRRARRAVDPAQTIVVSADRKVAGRARSAGCTTWTPWAFMAEIPDESTA
jgi:hypothetical protein